MLEKHFSDKILLGSEVQEHEGGSRFSTARVRTVALLPAIEFGVRAFHNSISSTSLTKLRENTFAIKTLKGFK